MRDSLQPTALITPLHDPPEGSVLGRIVAGISSVEILRNINRIVAITRNLEEVPAEIEAERPYCDYLSLHKLSEFKPYRPYSKSTREQLQNDEPLFWAKAQEELKQLRAAQEELKRLRAARIESRRFRGTALGYKTRSALTVRQRRLEKSTARDAHRR